MKFKNNKERFAHPVACLIPEELWSTLYEDRIYSIEEFSIAAIDLSKHSSEESYFIKLRIWLLTLIFNQEHTELLIDFAKNKLQLNVLDLLIIAASLGKLAIVAAFSQDEIKHYLNNLFKAAVLNNQLALVKYLAEITPEQLPESISTQLVQACGEAAGKGYLAIIKYLAELAPAQISTMISANDFYAFSRAAEHDQWAVIQYFIKIAPEQIIAMVKAEKFYVFRCAAGSGQLAILKSLAELVTTEQLIKIISAGEFCLFWKAADNGHLPIIEHLVEVAPKQLLAMISAKDFYPFSIAAEHGHLAIIKYLVEVAPTQLSAMISANDFHAFSMAAEHGHLAIIKYLIEVAPTQLSAMISANNFYAFSMAAEHGQLSIIKYLVEVASTQLSAMIQANDFYAFCMAAKHGHLAIIKYLAEIAPTQLIAMVSADDFYAFSGAAEQGHLAIIKYLAEVAPTQLIAMVSANDFYAFSTAAEHGHLSIMKYLAEVAPTQLIAMVSANDFYPFSIAAEEGHLFIIKYLAEVASEQLPAMLKTSNYYPFSIAAENSHLTVIKYFAEVAPTHFRAMISGGNFYTFERAIRYSRLSIVKYLLSFSKIYGYAEMHVEESDQTSFVIKSTDIFLRNLQEKISEYQEIFANGVFDFLTVEGQVDSEKALYGYYVLRQLIRQLPSNRYDNEAYTYISQLLAIPSIKYLVILNATQTSLPSTHCYAHERFAEQSNELLRLAANSFNGQVTQQLLAIPALYATAQRPELFELNLTELARSRESSMIGLTPLEQAQVKDLALVYQEKIAAYSAGITDVINELRAFLEQAFLSEEHLILRQITLKENTYTLPFSYEAFIVLIQPPLFTAAEVQQIKMVYYKNDYHTAWRYLARPNFWMHQQASYVYSDETGSWSTFEEYQSFIAYLWLAASDNNYPPLEKNVTVNHRIDLFIRQLALINRAHNWDKSRIKLTLDGRQILDINHKPITEEYDDLEGDRPSCFSGVKRRLFQALLNHPLYTPIDNSVIIQLIKQEIRTYYTQYLQSLTLNELIDLQQDIVKYWCEFTENERLKSLIIQDDSFIKEALTRQFNQRANACFALIFTLLHPAGLENTFLAHYQTLSLDSLLGQLINQKQEAVSIINQPEELLPSAVLTSNEKLLKEIFAEVQEALSRYKAYHRSHVSESADEPRSAQRFFTHETKNFPKAAAFFETLQAAIERTDSLINVLHTFKEFFAMSSQSFYPHSFTNYLAKALAKLQIITLREKSHYTQLEVISELESWLADYLARQEEIGAINSMD